MTISKDEIERAILRSEEKYIMDTQSKMTYARQGGRAEERAKWQSVIADKDAEIARLRAQIMGQTERCSAATKRCASVRSPEFIKNSCPFYKNHIQ